MGEVLELGGGPFSRGDRVQQVALIGLVPLDGILHVVDVAEQGIFLSTEPDGPPRTDLHEHPRLYPALKFRKVTW